MKVKDEGHVYELSNGETLTFLKRVDGRIIYAGTTNEEVLEALIDRINYLQNKLPCRENIIAERKLQEVLMWLNFRTKNREEQGVETTDKKHIS